MRLGGFLKVGGGVVAVAGLGLLGLALADRQASAVPGRRHAALHVNCPPGSHGAPRYATFGRSLGYGRDAGDVTARSLTAGRRAAPPRDP